VAIVQQLLETGKIDINSKGNDGRTPLLLAITNGHEAVVKQLLEAKADVNLKDTNGLTPLLLAAASG
jgi:ankyrin repeat protein